ncbi:HIT domain-containing protein [Candidatus Woesearchaeota archaeon]|nr:HIT domain-containing protein [Candidatus Woesearchaeota archaeon]
MSPNDENCVFCKIVKGDIPSVKIYEDDEFIAILDINPNTEGATLLISKQHYPSYIVDIPEEPYTKFFERARKIAKLLEKGLGVKRCAIVLEGMGINHAHLKIYPLHGISEEWHPVEAEERVYFKAYPGYVSTQLGPQASLEELEKVANKIREATSNNKL